MNTIRQAIDFGPTSKWYLFVVLIISLLFASVGMIACRSSTAGTALEVEGTTITVRKGGDFQAALNRAKPGDVILLQAGATFKGAFKLPNKPGNEFITIRSSATDEQLPAAKTRIDPAQYAAVLPKLQSDVKGKPVILANNGAHHFRFVAIEFDPTIEGLYDIIQIGTGAEKALEELPHHIEFDRVYIHGDPTLGQRRGIAANGRFVKIENSHISDIKRKGEESQAIAAWSTDGPIEIVNNYLEAAAENILFGGAAPQHLPLVPTDCIVYGNHLNKPIEWFGTEWEVKNLFEIKNGKSIKIENNLMTNNWSMGQEGIAVLITTRIQSGIATVIEDIIFTGNIVRGAGGAFNIWGGEGKGGHNLTIRNNIFEDIHGPRWKSAGHFLKISEWDGVTIENNTIFQTGNITLAYGRPIKNFVFRNNIVFHNVYGFLGDNIGVGQKAIDVYFPGSSISHNIILIKDDSWYRGNNIILSSIKEVGFVNLESKDFRLRKESPYINKGFDGRPIGAHIDSTVVGRR